jgi:integrase
LEHGALSDLEYAKANARLRAAQGREVALRGQPFKRPETFGRRSIDLLTLKPVTSKGKKASGPQFKATAERYIEEVQRHPDTKLTEQTKGQYEAVFRLFQQWAGDPSLGEIDRAKSSEFLDVIASLNPLWGRSPKTKKRTFAEIFKDYGNHSPGLSNRTINRYSVALSLIWAWAEGRGLFEGKNPWTGQQRKEPERRKVMKLPYTVAELGKLLLRLPDPQQTRHSTPSALPWLCWIAAFSGMRLNEICSLRKSDIKQDGRVWFFDIVNAKTEAGDRRVPIHSALLRIGLMDYEKKIEDEWLFPGLKPGGPDNKRGWYASKHFTVVRRSLGVIQLDPASGKDRVDFHSFRRSAIQALEQARVPQSEAAQIVGHEREGITFGTYNPIGLTMIQRREIVEKIKYPKLKLPTLN